MAFTTPDAETHHARLGAAGFDMQPLVHLTRQVEGGTLRFSVVRMIHGQMAEGRIQFLQHNTPDLLWREELMHHPNKVVSMTDVAMAAVALEQPPILREIQAVPPAAVPSVTPPCAPQVLTDSVVRCALAAAGTVRLNTIRDTPSS